jgi:class 3 adenylate cyclase
MGRQGQSWLSSVVCVGTVGDPQLAGAERVVARTWLRSQIATVVADVRENERIIVDTADGAAICFLGDPEDALFAATDLRVRLISAPPAGPVPPRFRIGIHVGPIRVIKNPDGQMSPIGDGLGNAQQVMGFAEPGQILVSRSFFEVIACLSQGYAQLFHYLGLKNDERVRELPVYEVTASGDGAQTTRVVDVPPTVSPSTEVLAYSTGWERAELTAAAIALEPYVGSRARALVKEAAERATSVTQLYRALAASIPTTEGRAEFCRAHGITDDPVAPPSNRAPNESQGASSRAPPQVISAALRHAAETQLAAFLGPMARILVNRHAQGQRNALEFLTALAKELPVERRQAFLTAMRRVDDTP